MNITNNTEHFTHGTEINYKKIQATYRTPGLEFNSPKCETEGT
jgi:hypothetical protein